MCHTKMISQHNDTLSLEVAVHVFVCDLIAELSRALKTEL